MITIHIFWLQSVNIDGEGRQKLQNCNSRIMGKYFGDYVKFHIGFCKETACILILSTEIFNQIWFHTDFSLAHHKWIV